MKAQNTFAKEFVIKMENTDLDQEIAFTLPTNYMPVPELPECQGSHQPMMALINISTFCP